MGQASSRSANCYHGQRDQQPRQSVRPEFGERIAAIIDPQRRDLPDEMRRRRKQGDKRQQLRARNIQPAAEHVGGAGHRKLVFDLTSGEVRLRFKDLEKEMTSG